MGADDGDAALMDVRVEIDFTYGNDLADMAVAHGWRWKVQTGMRLCHKEGPLRSRTDETRLGRHEHLVLHDRTLTDNAVHRFETYVEYGRRCMQLVDAARKGALRSDPDGG